MSIVAFPARNLTAEDEAEIIARAGTGGYCCRRAVADTGAVSIELLDNRGQVRGYVNKENCVYTVLNPRRFVVVESRSLDDVLSALTK